MIRRYLANNFGECSAKKVVFFAVKYLALNSKINQCAYRQLSCLQRIRGTILFSGTHLKSWMLFTYFIRLCH